MRKKEIFKLKKKVEQYEIRIPVCVGIPFNLLSIVDENANCDGISRSEFVVQALKEKVEAKKNV